MVFQPSFERKNDIWHFLRDKKSQVSTRLRRRRRVAGRRRFFKFLARVLFHRDKFNLCLSIRVTNANYRPSLSMLASFLASNRTEISAQRPGLGNYFKQARKHLS